MLNSTAVYNAECWGNGRAPSEIAEEIQRLESMWTSKLPNPFPRSAHYAYSRLVTLQNILSQKQLTSVS